MNGFNCKYFVGEPNYGSCNVIIISFGSVEKSNGDLLLFLSCRLNRSSTSYLFNPVPCVLIFC